MKGGGIEVGEVVVEVGFKRLLKPRAMVSRYAGSVDLLCWRGEERTW